MGQSMLRQMQVAFALFADAANLSQEGKLNVLGVFDALQVGQLPAVHPRAHLVVHLKGTLTDVGRHTVTLRWINPQGSELWTSTGELNVGQPPSGVTDMDLPLIAQIDLPIDGAGKYKMTVSLDDRQNAEVPVQVRTVQAVRPPGGLFS
ncbi:MAG TPA: hypothetical protein VFT29_11420 [Gemmatimonadaceae bacterium]|nr:hypothetical protein [Gemmatimonadaceae bacterium]